MLCALDVTMEVVAEAVVKRCNLIITHHPLLFKGLKKLRSDAYPDAVLLQALRHGIALYAAHTNLDNVVNGVSGKMAQMLGLKEIRVLVPAEGMLRKLVTFVPENKAEELRDALFTGGAGGIGNYSECSFTSEGTGSYKAGEGASPFVGEVGKQHLEEESRIEVVFPFYLQQQVVQAMIAAHPYEEVAYDIIMLNNPYPALGTGVTGFLQDPLPVSEFLQVLKKVFGTGVIRHTAGRVDLVRSVALCGGAGAFLIPTALASGADIFVTSDLKYHDFFETKERMILSDIGHYESEQFSIELLHDLIVQKFPTFAVQKTAVITNPVRYYL